MYCCMLLDRKGQAIQANIEIKDHEKYNELQLDSAYQIQRFGCQKTEKWMQTLDTKYTLVFGKFTTLSPIPGDNFPEHYFRFAAYNEVARRLDAKQTLLTDYIGYIGNIDKEIMSGGVTTNIVTR